MTNDLYYYTVYKYNKKLKEFDTYEEAKAYFNEIINALEKSN